MPTCVNIKKKHRKVCVGDLEDYGTIKTRAVTAPSSGSVDATETFTTDVASFMLIESKRGEIIFDDIETDEIVTHHVYVPFVTGLTAEDFIDVETQRYRILDVEDLDNRHEFQLCRCTNRGLASKAASDA